MNDTTRIIEYTQSEEVDALGISTATIVDKITIALRRRKDPLANISIDKFDFKAGTIAVVCMVGEIAQLVKNSDLVILVMTAQQVAEFKESIKQLSITGTDHDKSLFDHHLKVAVVEGRHRLMRIERHPE